MRITRTVQVRLWASQMGVGRAETSSMEAFHQETSHSFPGTPRLPHHNTTLAYTPHTPPLRPSHSFPPATCHLREAAHKTLWSRLYNHKHWEQHLPTRPLPLTSHAAAPPCAHSHYARTTCCCLPACRCLLLCCFAAAAAAAVAACCCLFLLAALLLLACRCCCFWFAALLLLACGCCCFWFAARLLLLLRYPRFLKFHFLLGMQNTCGKTKALKKIGDFVT